jgi:hypothetical protein
MSTMNSRITYADVASTLALVVAIFGGGVAVASSLPKLPKDSVTSKQVKNGTLEGKDIDDNAITGPKIDEASLGKVPSAASADRAASADQAAEVDTVRHVAASLTAGLNDSTMLHSGPFTLSLTCNPFGNARSSGSVRRNRVSHGCPRTAVPIRISPSTRTPSPASSRDRRTSSSTASR